MQMFYLLCSFRKNFFVLWHFCNHTIFLVVDKEDGVVNLFTLTRNSMIFQIQLCVLDHVYNDSG